MVKLKYFDELTKHIKLVIDQKLLLVTIQLIVQEFV